MLAGGLYERTSGAAGQPLASGYQRRTPERTVLHELVSRHAQTLLAELRDADGRGLPRHVERELAAYLRCGLLAHGFARVRCQTCAAEILVAFSCKRRGICPSCTARRMADTAARLVDHILPSAPYRPWVLSLPKPLRLRLARHPAWTTWVGGLIVRAIAAWQRRVARARHLAAPQTGAITFVQRFGGLVNLNVHFHLLVPDGVFTPTADDGLAFARLPAPTGTDLLAILDRVIRCIARRIADETGGGDDDAPDPGPDLFAQIQAEAVTTWRSPATATSDVVRGTDCLRARSEGFSLHAGVVIADHDREALERLARYGASARVRPRSAHLDLRRPDLVQAQAPVARRPHPPRRRARRVPPPARRHHPSAQTPSGSRQRRVSATR